MPCTHAFETRHSRLPRTTTPTRATRAGHGPKGEGEAFNKTERERHFPTSLLEAGLDASVAAAHTSVEHDTRALHAHLASTHVPQDVVEGAVRGRFAVAALRKALDETPYDGGTFFRRCLHALSASPLTHVSAHFSGCVSFDPTLGAAFAQALPPTLESLSVHFSDVDEKAAEVTDSEAQRGRRSLAPPPITLSLSPASTSLARLSPSRFLPHLLFRGTVPLASGAARLSPAPSAVSLLSPPSPTVELSLPPFRHLSRPSPHSSSRQANFATKVS